MANLDTIKSMVDHIKVKNMIDASADFQSVMSQAVQSKLDDMRDRLAQQVYNTNVELPEPTAGEPVDTASTEE
jgi:hypothetical protein